MDGYASRLAIRCSPNRTDGECRATGTCDLSAGSLFLSQVLHPHSLFYHGHHSFTVGISRCFHGRQDQMQSWVIDFEAITFAVIGVFADYIPDVLSDCLIASCAAMSFENFRELGQGSRYSSTYCTGNLRSFSEALYEGTFGHEPSELRRALHYLALIGSFFIGVVICSYFVERIGALLRFSFPSRSFSRGCLWTGGCRAAWHREAGRRIHSSMEAGQVVRALMRSFLL